MSTAEVQPEPEQPQITWDLVDRLYKSLRLAKLKPGQMADHLDVHRNTVGGWLRGKAITKSALIAWAAKCNETSAVPITFDWLAGRGPGWHHAASVIDESSSACTRWPDDDEQLELPFRHLRAAS